MMSEEDSQIVYLSLSMRKCYIETGNTSISAADLKENPNNAKVFGASLQPLSIDQMKLLIRIDDLMQLASKGTLPRG